MNKPTQRRYATARKHDTRSVREHADQAVDTLQATGAYSVSPSMPVVQPKLEIGGQDSAAEKEADAVANQLVKKQGVTSSGGGEVPTPNTSSDGAIQLKADPRGSGNQTPVTQPVQQALNSNSSGGQGLPANQQEQWGQQLGTDLSNVRVHTDSKADDLSRSVGARAFAHGQNIYFKQGEYNPQSTQGQHLLAHETAHTVQQSNHGSLGVQRVTPEGETTYVPSWQAYQDMELWDIIANTNNQLDWYNGPAFTAANDPTGNLKSTLRQLLAYAGGDHYKLPVRVTLKQLIADVNGVAVETVGPEEGFTADPAPIFSDLTDAMATKSTGANFFMLDTLEGLGDFQAKLTYLQANLPNPTAQLAQMGDAFVDLTLTDCQDLVTYLNTPAPDTPKFETINDYLGFGIVNASATKVAGFQTALSGRVRDVHRFAPEALTQLVTNFGRTGIPAADRDRLVVILHANNDHNGATVQDPNTTEIIMTHNADGASPADRIMVLMLEGKPTIGEYLGEFAKLAQTYGRWDRIDQFVVHGHGFDEGIGVGDAAPSVTYDAITGDPIVHRPGLLSLSVNEADTRALFTEVLHWMEINSNVPAAELTTRSRIVFAACLTNSNDVPLSLASGNANKAQREIRSWLNSNPNFVSEVENMLPTTTDPLASTAHNIDKVIGSNAVTTQNVGVINASNELDLYGDEFRPALTGSKIEYVEFGRQTESVMTALMTEWAAVDLTNYQTSDLYQAVVRRSLDMLEGVGSDDLRAGIRAAYYLFTNPPENFIDPKMLRATTTLSLQYASTANDNVEKLYDLRKSAGLNKEDYNVFLEGFHGTNYWIDEGYRHAATVLQVQARLDREVYVPQLFAMLSSPDLNFYQMVNSDWLNPEFMDKFKMYKEGEWLTNNNNQGQVLVAAAGIFSDSKKIKKTSTAFLQPLMVANDLGPQFVALIPDVELRNKIREQLGITTLEATPLSDSDTQTNLPLQSTVGTVDAKDDFLGTPRYETVEGRDLPVYPSPDPTSTPIATFATGTTAFTAAAYLDWFAIEWPGFGTAFVKQNEVTVQP